MFWSSFGYLRQTPAAAPVRGADERIEQGKGADTMTQMSKRIAVITKIVEKKPGIGKTAMMKCIYLLQRLYKVPLGYDYEIYTHGPYCSAVMAEIDFASFSHAIAVEKTTYTSGSLKYTGYLLSPGEKAADAIQKGAEFVSEHRQAIQNVVDLMGDKTAKELELLSTIVYIYHIHYKNNWGNMGDGVVENVHEIKPHFSVDTIEKAFNELRDKGIFELIQ
jgi:uncharacterized protein YwgA